MVGRNRLVFLIGSVAFLSLRSTAQNRTKFCITDEGERKCCNGHFLRNTECVECPDGRIGINCSLKCPDGFFGVKCLKICNCSEKERCDNVHGCVSPPGNSNKTIMVIVPAVVCTVVIIGTVLIILYFRHSRTSIPKCFRGNVDDLSISFRSDHQQRREYVDEEGNTYDDLRASRMLPECAVNRATDMCTTGYTSRYHDISFLRSMEDPAEDDEYNFLSLKNRNEQNTNEYGGMTMDL